MKNQHDETEDLDDLANSVTDVIWRWLTSAVTKIRKIVRKSHQKRE